MNHTVFPMYDKYSEYSSENRKATANIIVEEQRMEYSGKRSPIFQRCF